jgi:hypothetical protein
MKFANVNVNYTNFGQIKKNVLVVLLVHIANKLIIIFLLGVLVQVDGTTSKKLS